jgi:RNA polymerase sigma factor (sigma-70 family)
MAGAPQELQDLLEARGPGERDEAWARFVNRFSPLLLHTARSLTPEHDRAMDAYVHVLERLREDDCRRLRVYVEDPRSQFMTWLVIVARHLCLDHLRQRYGRFRADRSTDPALKASRRRLVDLIAKEIGQAGPLLDPTAGADEQLRRRDLASALEASLARLSSAQRLLLAMRFEDNRSAREIAQLLRYPTPFHVYRALNALLRELRASLTERGISDSQP